MNSSASQPALTAVRAASRDALPVRLVSAGDSLDAGEIGALAAASGLAWRVGDVATVLHGGRPALLAGLGPAGALNAAAMRVVGAAVARAVRQPRIAVHGLGSLADARLAASFADAVVSASYTFGRYRTTAPAPARLESVEFVAGDDPAHLAALAAELAGVAMAARARGVARDLVNEAPSTLTPRAFAEAARAVADEAGLDIEVLDEGRLAEERCGGILGIGRGSAEPPRLVIISTRTQDPVATVALVGKGITFDAGGLFVKRPESMASMKGDMAGAAAILGAIAVAGQCAPRVQVRAYLALSENLPGERAIKPGDVVTARNGKTIEVNDPDAEGRVVLADGLSMASELAPDLIVDLATLTGSKMEALGTGLAAVFATSDLVADLLGDAGDRSGEPVWRLPLVEAYRPAMNSAIADLKVFDTTPHCPDALLAALFLREFVGPGTPWAHLDMAGCEFGTRDGEIPEGMATGWGARLLVELLRLLQAGRLRSSGG